jgi:energy-coupling factor transport system ATP-binding protein
MLSFEQISYRYQGTADLALANVSFSLMPGEYVVLLGSNGSGKSTLARLANGLLLPEEGTVRVDELTTSERTTIRTLRSRVGVIAQDPDNQIVSTTVLDEVAFGPENLGLTREEIIERVNGALTALGLAGLEERDPNTLSGGEKQRLIIAGILAMNPNYLVLDEPTSMLDRVGRAEVRNAMRLLHSRGHGVLHITHDLSFAREADRVLVLQGGKLVFAGSPAMLLNNEDLLTSYELKVSEAAFEALKGASGQKNQENLENPKNQENQGAPSTQNPPDTAKITTPTDDRLIQILHPVTAPRSRQARGGMFPSLHLNNVYFTYGENTDSECTVLRGVSLDIAPGSYTLITGSSGSGKSTLLRILSGLLEPSLGTAAFSNGNKLFPSAVGIVFQHPESQLFAQTVEDEITFGPSNLGLIPKRSMRGDIVREALDAVGLDPKVFFHRSPFSLSGGEMRRVAIAGILAMRPAFLLLDEPTAGLDAAGRAFIHVLIDKLTHATAGVVVVSHDIEEFESRAQTHLELRDGRLWHR